ncbi:O-antigen translocase [Formosa algae]|uniref:PST family polysaccharide transporter n=1 Tax=Formosa algae TaxID=225843 RepID=A0A9X1CAZ4_9FLAO|nr:O-antigen translocase [Formosa algae]MBP1839522.1 PST family polysaccharide transporter [Formosa algae]MDQ0334826.1 PST family polysaccharide transporter [Formosa algae]OEI82070.1 lipopolysaccharide biosynthesis protein [Formosa algae]PNW27392.1 O-antigen translocase [Formosa algae]
MRKLIDYINNNVLIKVASLNSASVITKIVTGFLTSKAIAIFIGAEGLALIGNLRNLVSSMQAFAVLGMYNGIVKYIAEFKNNTVELSKTLSTAFYLGFISTIIVAFLCYFNAEYINTLIFPTYNDYAYVIRIMAIALPFYSMNMFAFSIMNGFSKYKMLLIINIIGQILGASITLILIYQNRIDGALISIVIAESIIFLITLVGVVNQRSLIPLIRSSQVNFTNIKNLSSYSIMALFSALILPLVAISIRTYIIDNIGYKDAGFWEAMTRISKYYLMFVSSLMSLYILPRFSEIDNNKEFREEVFGFYKTIIPVFGLGLLVIFLLRRFIVAIVFTDEFKPVEDLFLWQLLGDFIKVLSIVISYQFLAKKMFWHYIITEAFSVMILYLTSIYFIDLYGVKGATIAHFVTYVMYYGIILLIFSSSLFGVIGETEILKDKYEDDENEEED